MGFFDFFKKRRKHEATATEDNSLQAVGLQPVLIAPQSAPMTELPPPPYDFDVDRPFLFFVVERATQLPVFSGHVLEPS